MRVLLWHGWLLEGSGSNVFTARTAAVLRRAGHDVVLLCQEPHPDRLPWVDRWGAVDADGPGDLTPTGVPSASGRVVLLRPVIGSLLPVFVWDEYEGWEVKRFVDLTDGELHAYLGSNERALRAAATWHRPEAAVTGHAIPGAVLGRRALGEGRYVAKVHGSDLEYAVKLQPRYLELAREGLEGAAAVTGAGGDVLSRAVDLIPSIAGRTRTVPPGVDVETFRPAPRREALDRAVRLLSGDPTAAGGRPSGLDGEVADAVARRDAAALDNLAARYDQAAPDPDAGARLAGMAETEGPLVGYLGKFIPQKGVHLLLAALAFAQTRPRALLVGFGTGREWLQAVVDVLDRADAPALEWLAGRLGPDLELEPADLARALGLAERMVFTGRLDHRYAGVVAALDILVVPSVLDEAFGMVAAEGAAAGALPLLARHSGLGEVAEALEGAVGRPGLFSFDPGPGVGARIARGIDRLLELPVADRAALRDEVSRFAAAEWTWERTARRLLDARSGPRPVE